MTARGKCLVIGGHSGIGETTVKLLRKEHPKLELLVPPRLALDVTNRTSIKAVMLREGPFSDIVYSAGINQLGWVGDRQIGLKMVDQFDTNCAGFVSVISEHLRCWPEQATSAVAVSSDAGGIPMRGSVAYCASKAALNMAVRVMARELAPLYRINAISPGMVEDTPMTDYIDQTIPAFRGWTPDQALNYERQGTPTRRRATREEVAEAIVWALLGPEQMTGTIIDVNGGR